MGATFETFYDRVNPNEIIDFIVRFKIDHNGIAPSSREIMQAVGISSTSIVNYHLGKLAENGRITYSLGRGVPRAIAVPGYTFTEASE